MKLSTSETDIQRSICDYLALRHHFFWRSNTAPTVQKSAEGWAFRKMPKYGMRGVPDIIVIKDGFFVGLEVKAAKGRQSPEQIAFEDRVKEAGGEYYVVKSIDEVREIGL